MNKYMNDYQELLIITIGSINFFIFISSWYMCKYKRKQWSLTPMFYPFGIFVWADGFMFGLFWFLASLISLLLNDWYLFCFIISVFWLVRSLGETIYWFNQQFSTVIRVKPEEIPGLDIFHDDSIWFVFQTFMQVIAIVSIIFTVYFGYLWVQSLG